MVRYKRSLSMIILLAMSAFLAWLLYSALQPPVLPIGAKLPHASYETGSGIDTLRSAPNKTTLVMLFSSKCPHCLYELDLFEKNIDKLAGSKIYVCTVENEFKPGIDNLRWPRLSGSREFTWIYIKDSEFKNFFGTIISPSLFIFNREGLLIKKIRGEAKVEMILSYL